MKAWTNMHTLSYFSTQVKVAASQKLIEGKLWEEEHSGNLSS